MGTRSNEDANEIRPYHDTHVWISFVFNVKSLPADLVAQLGGVAARCRVLESVLLPPQLSEELHTIYLAKGVHATTAIEGNALTEKEVQNRVGSGRRAKLATSKEYAVKEVDNILDACNLITENLVKGVGFRNCRSNVSNSSISSS